MAAPVDLKLQGGKELNQIVKELKAAGEGELRKQMVKDLRRAAKPAVPKVRAAIMAIPSSHDGSLRRAMSKAVKLQVRSSGRQAGITIRVDGRKMPAGKGGLPSLMEGRRKPWRHPVFGNTSIWRNQDSHPYFYKQMTPVGNDVRKEINQIVARVADQITP